MRKAVVIAAILYETAHSGKYPDSFTLTAGLVT